jgi:hypothetical protein
VLLPAASAPGITTGITACAGAGAGAGAPSAVGRWGLGPAGGGGLLPGGKDRSVGRTESATTPVPVPVPVPAPAPGGKSG